MQQAVLAREDVHEGAEVHDADDLAVVDAPDLRLGGDLLDAGHGGVLGVAVLAVDAHAAVVFHVHLGTGLLDDRANGRATLADDVADLVGIDLQHDHARRVLGHRVAGLREHLVHLAEDMQTRVVRLLEGGLHDLLGDTVDLDVHLQRGHPVGGAGDLEVHVAEVVLVTEDVGQHREAVAFLDQAHGDAGYRRRHRHTGIHQCQRAAAHGGHGTRAVALGDLRDDPDGVGEVLLARQAGGDAAPRQIAVADFAALRSPHESFLAHTVGREVVVQHEVVLEGAVEPFHQLGVAQRTEGGDHDGLCLAALEQRRAVGLRQHADFHADRAHGPRVAAVDAGLAVEHVVANDALLELVERFDDVVRRVLAVIAAQGVDQRIARRAYLGLALLLVPGAVGVGQALPGCGIDLLRESRVDRGRLELPLRLAGFGGELLDRVDRRLHFLVGEENAAEHLVLGQFLGLGLDHEHGRFGARHDHVERRRGQFLVAGVQQVRAIRVADASRRNGAVERNAGNGERSRRSDQRNDVRIHVPIHRHDGGDDLGGVHESVREQRPDRAVDQSRGKCFLVGRSSLAAKKSTGDSSGGVGLFLVVHRQREKVLSHIR